MDVAVVTLFPEMFDAIRRGGVTARALERKLLRLRAFNPRDFSRDAHRRVDDRPYGGGPGMVMQLRPVRAAVRAARTALGSRCHAVYLSPQGRRLDQAAMAEMAAREHVILVCGRYEGVDERLTETEIDEECSIGDYVLSGGELAAMVVVDAVARLLPGALGHADSAAEDSFSAGLLDHPQYTRPETVDGQRVPAVLLNGNHEEIRRWRRKQALGRTWLRRRDMLEGLALDEESESLLKEFIAGHEREPE